MLIPTTSFPNTLIYSVNSYRVGIRSTSDYSGFGVQLDGRTSENEDYRFGFNSMEKDDEIKGAGNSYDFGARMYDARVGRWLSVDPLEDKYPMMSVYSFVANTPIIAIDPDGKRIYFIGGAGNDSKGWNYIERFIKIFKENSLDVKRIDASFGEWTDIWFTGAYRKTPWILKQTGTRYNNTLQRDINPTYSYIRVASYHKTIKKAVKEIIKDLQQNPLKEGEQFNLMGYSYGSVAQAHIALALSDLGYKVDNVILIGSPIPDDSDLFRALNSSKNIGNVIRHDIENDKLSNPSNDTEFGKGGFQNLKDDAPHFDLARPDNPETKDTDEGKEADKKIDQLAKKLKKSGVK
jgi:RHS repeat-associated protein